jgi:predicted SAM-dependent methyltransferase
MDLVRKARNSYKLGRLLAIVERVVSNPITSAYRCVTLPARLRSDPSPKIHFGCGEIADRRFINVDARIFPHVDYVTSSPLMPAVKVQSADLIYACHVFEHISYFDGQKQTLARWYEILKPGGRLMLSVPDFDKVVGLYNRGERNFEWMQAVLMGGQDYPGNFHFALFTRERLCKLLTEAGFVDVHDWRSDQQEKWPKDWSWDERLSLNLWAIKP